MPDMNQITKDTQDPQEIQKSAMARYEAGERVLAIVADLGISSATLYRWIKESGLCSRNRKSLDSGGVEIGQEIKSQVRKLMGQGISRKKIAETLGITSYETYLACPASRRKNSTTIDLDTMRDMVNSGADYADIASELGCTTASIYRHFPVKRNDHGDDSQRQKEVLQYYLGHEDATYKSTAQHFGITLSYVYRVVKKHGHKGRGNRIADAPAKMQKAKEMYATGMSIAAIALEMKVGERWLMRVLDTRSRREAAKKDWAKRKASS